LAETYVELYRSVCDGYEKKIGNQPTTEEANMIFEQTCKRIISDLIGKQRQGVPSQQSSSSEQKPSEKQIAWAKKLGCDNPEGFSRKELSEWLDEHKND
ncbi:hypothetical protein KA005_31930, partial [bacterium]|nr:hypothetical protein [bacterium]